MMENRNVSNVGRDIAFLRLYESIVFFESMFGYALLVNSIKFCASIRKFMVNSEHRAWEMKRIRRITFVRILHPLHWSCLKK